MKDDGARKAKLLKLHRDLGGIETRLGVVKNEVYRIDVKKKIFSMI